LPPALVLRCLYGVAIALVILCLIAIFSGVFIPSPLTIHASAIGVLLLAPAMAFAGLMNVRLRPNAD
jgi:hypothetical protein